MMLKHAFFLLTLTCLGSCVSYTDNQKTPMSDSIQFNSIKQNDYQVHYAYSGDATKLGVLFIHGTPGSWNAFKGYLDNPSLQENYFMVSADRLGWGQSNSSIDDVATEFEEQSNAISSIINHFPNKQWIIVGHSYGASLAPKLAIDNPKKTRALLLLAGSHSPKLGKPRWYNQAANNRLIAWLMPNSLKRSNNEIMALKTELQELEYAMQSNIISSPIVVIQGMKDKLVSPKNIGYVHKAWQQQPNVNVIELPNAGHFLPWRHTATVIEQLHQLAE